MRKIYTLRFSKTYIIALLFTFFTFVPAEASGRPASNAQQARQLFNEVYNKVFGPSGSSLSYSINIIGLYKTAGTVVMHGMKKIRYTEKRYQGWCDGRTLYRVDTKKHIVDIFDPNKKNKDNMASQYTFNINDFNYSWENSKEGIVINIDARGGHSTISHAKAIIDRRTHNPIAVKVKVAFFWTTIKLSGFRTGGVNDHIFVFPRNQFRSYKFVDHRRE